MKNEALQYLQLGFSVIPVGKDKRPLVPWKAYQKRHCTKDEIETWWKDYPHANIGFVTGKISKFVAIDIDSKVGEDNINKLLPKNFKSPTVQTPSGFYHIYCIWQDGLRNNAKKLEGVDFRGEGGYVVAPPSKNGQGRYTWIHDPVSTPLAPVPPEYLKILLQNPFYTPANNPRTHINSNHTKTISLTKGNRNESIFHVANTLSKGGMLPGNIRYVLHNLVCQCDPPLSHEEAETIIGSVLARLDKYERSITEDIRHWVSIAPGFFMTSDIFTDLGITQRNEKKYAHKVLNQLIKENLVERDPKRRGGYFLPDKDMRPIDWMSASTKDYGLVLPFGISKIVRLFHKSVVIIAGDQNAGKTAIMLNIIKDNMNLHKTTLFSSETSDSELKSRLMLFRNIPLSKWNFRAFERTHHFDQVIDPDGLNLIDYMEVSDEFWKVGHHIAKIHHTLDKGIAVIALQKKRGSDVGRGGDFTLEKPRLYLTVGIDQDLQQHIVKIRKAKDYVDPLQNPNGMYRTFTIQGGCEIIPQSGWHRL